MGDQLSTVGRTPQDIQPQDPATRIAALKSRVQNANNLKIGAEKTLEILKQTYDQKLIELKNLGIADVQELPVKIVELQNKLNEKLSIAETQMATVETQLQAIQ
jgi:hypothetical protein